MVSRRGKGTGYPAHRRASSTVPIVLTDGAAVFVRGAETSQVNAYQFKAVMPLFPGLNGSVSLRNFHLDDYPKHTQTETTDA